MSQALLIGLSVYSLLMFTSGCATVVNGTRQKVGVSSNPPGASVLIDNQTNVITPATVDLARDQSHTFHFRKDGYQDDSFVITSGTSGWVLGNILLGGLIGGVVDFASGGARKLSHDSVHVTLAPLSAQAVSTAPAVYAVPSAPPPQALPVQTLPATPPPIPVQTLPAPPPPIPPAQTVIPASYTIPAPAPAPSASQPAIYNDAPAADTQLRNAEREFRAGRMSLEEFREIKRVLQGQ